jgi:hypothetical protein
MLPVQIDADIYIQGYMAIRPPYASGANGVVLRRTDPEERPAESSGVWNELLRQRKLQMYTVQ